MLCGKGTKKYAKIFASAMLNNFKRGIYIRRDGTCNCYLVWAFYFLSNK